MQKTGEQSVYIVISQTGSIISKMLKAITGDEYNHVSISLTSDLVSMYSFGRKYPYYPFWGGLILETLNTGMFKRFPKTRAVVLSVPIKQELYQKMEEYIINMYRQRKKYRYNYLGVALAGLHINYSTRRRYYCSEFVRHVLLEFGVDGADDLSPVIHPIHFLNLPSADVVYEGMLREYTKGQFCFKN